MVVLQLHIFLYYLQPNFNSNLVYPFGLGTVGGKKCIVFAEVQTDIVLAEKGPTCYLVVCSTFESHINF